MGGTDFAQQSVIGEEIVWSDGGGGFSDTFGIPSYQAEAISNYLSVAADTLPPQSYWNSTGR